MNQPVLLITGEADLCEHMQRLAAAAGTALDIFDGSSALSMGEWRAARIVLIGQDRLAAVIEEQLPRRSDVIIVAVDDPFGGPTEIPEVTWRGAVAVGAGHVVRLPEAEGWLIDRLGEITDSADRGGPVVSVLSGTGGAGATTFARLLASGIPEATALLDVDPLGPEHIGLAEQGLRWPDLAATRGRVPAAALRESLPTLGRVAILTGMTPGVDLAAREAVLDAASRGFALTVVDAPRAVDDASRMVWARSDLVIVIVGPDAQRAESAVAVVEHVRATTPEIQVVPRTSAGVVAGWVYELSDILRAPVSPPWRHDRALARGERPEVASIRTWRPAVQSVFDRLAIAVDGRRSRRRGVA